MTVHFLREIDKLKQMVLGLGALVEENVRRSVRAIEERDEAAAKSAIELDVQIDEREVEVEEEGLKILALHQPVAGDLRFVIAALKINNDLERIGDLAVNIAERALYLCTRPVSEVNLNFEHMAEKARAMLTGSLDALVNLDADAARKICAADDEVDALNREMYNLVKDALLEEQSRNLEDVNILIHLLSVSRHLERVADLATNIAEDVIYMTEGKIIRHRTEDLTGDGE